MGMASNRISNIPASFRCKSSSPISSNAKHRRASNWFGVSVGSWRSSISAVLSGRFTVAAGGGRVSRGAHRLDPGFLFPAADLVVGVHGSAAIICAAVTGLGVIASVVEAIVIGDLGAGGYVLDGPDPDTAAYFVGFAIGIATVIDEHGHAVPIDDRCPPAESKQVGYGRFFVEGVGFGLAQARPGIFRYA